MLCTVVDIRGDYAYVKYDQTGVISEVAIALLPFGIDIGDQRVFVPMGYVEVVDWEQRLVRGKARKEKIRSAAVNSLPVQWRHLFS